ncbi:hypothetical protein ACFU9Y_34075, partial [Streptomyces sp. NPDC057621]
GEVCGLRREAAALRLGAQVHPARGTGLPSLGERLRLAEGELTWHRDGEDFAVTALLPIGPATAAGPVGPGTAEAGPAVPGNGAAR